MSDPRVRSHDRSLVIIWVGHATVLIELDGVRFLTDPVLRDRIGPLVRIAPAGGVEPPGRVDCVLLSHLHADHADLPSLRAVARGVPVVAPGPAGEWLNRQGLRDVREIRAGSEIRFGELTVRAMPAVHDDRRRPLGPRADPVGYLVQGLRASVYFAGDTDLFGAMEDMRGSVTAALLPVWGWGPLLGPGHLDPERAARAAALIAPEVAIPIHWGTFALPWAGGRGTDRDRPAREFARLAERYAPAVEVRVLAPGERIEL